MSLKKLTLALAIALAFSVGAIAAETTVGGTMFMKYGFYNLSEETDGMAASDTATGERHHGFALDRMYVTVKSKINDVWSVNVTLDASDDNAKTNIYLKKAEVKAQAAPFMAVKMGIIGMPEYKIVHSPNGMRWLDKPVLDRMEWGAASAELGVGVDLNIAKMVYVGLAFTTANSYKDLDDIGVGNDYALAVAVQATLIEKLKVGVFGKIHMGESASYEILDTADTSFAALLPNGLNSKAKDTWYIGAGVAWQDKFYKAGVNWVMYNLGETKEFDFTNLNAASLGAYPDISHPGIYNVFEVYGNINLAGAINIPLLVLARAQLDLNKWKSEIGAGPDDATGLAGFSFSVGVGYKFNENAQVALVYRGTMGDETLFDKEGTMMTSDITLQSEVKF